MPPLLTVSPDGNAEGGFCDVFTGRQEHRGGGGLKKGRTASGARSMRA